MDSHITVPTLSTTTAALTQFTPTSNVTPVEVTVTSTPPNVDQLLRQIQISGTVSSPPSNGSVTLNTALGNFTFSLAQLPENVKQQLLQQFESLFQNQKPITATIQPGAPPTQAVLLLPTTTTPQAASVNLASQLPQILTLTAGTSVTAVVLPPDIVVPGTQTSATASTASTATTASVNSNSTANAPPLNIQTLTTGSTAAPASPTPSTISPSLQPLLQPGKEVTVQINSVSLPSAPAPVASSPNQIAATVIGSGANGQLILKAGDATLYVRANVEAPVGTNLLVTLEAPKSTNLTVLPPVQDQNFQSLQQVLSALTEINPQLAQQIIDTRIPQPNAQLAAPLLFFLSALKQGDTKGWLGTNVSEAFTKADKLDLLAKLGRDMGEATQTEHDNVVGEWKSYSVPLHNQGQWQNLTLHVHKDGGNKSANGSGGNSPEHLRFLIDMRMSRLGLMQLDGLVRPKKLDMIVRSESALPPGLPQDLRNSYLNTISAMGYTGSLSFQNGVKNWISPRKEIQQSLVT